MKEKIRQASYAVVFLLLLPAVLFFVGPVFERLIHSRPIQQSSFILGIAALCIAAAITVWLECTGGCSLPTRVHNLIMIIVVAGGGWYLMQGGQQQYEKRVREAREWSNPEFSEIYVQLTLDRIIRTPGKESFAEVETSNPVLVWVDAGPYNIRLLPVSGFKVPLEDYQALLEKGEAGGNTWEYFAVKQDNVGDDIITMHGLRPVP